MDSTLTYTIDHSDLEKLETEVSNFLGACEKIETEFQFSQDLHTIQTFTIENCLIIHNRPFRIDIYEDNLTFDLDSFIPVTRFLDENGINYSFDEHLVYNMANIIANDKIEIIDYLFDNNFASSINPDIIYDNIHLYLIFAAKHARASMINYLRTIVGEAIFNDHIELIASELSMRSPLITTAVIDTAFNPKLLLLYILYAIILQKSSVDLFSLYVGKYGLDTMSKNVLLRKALEENSMEITSFLKKLK